jgi:predicted O-methyltransferase YrrM
MFKDFPSVKGNVLFDAQMSSYDMADLERLMEYVKPERSLEVGSWKGISTAIIARHSDILYCVDTWKGGTEPEATGMAQEAEEVDVFQVFEHNLRVMGLRDKVQVLYMNSEHAQKVINKGIFNFIYIDAGHGLEDILMDLNWEDYLAPGGIIAGHDFDDGHWHVKEQVKKRWPGEELKTFQHSSIWYIDGDKF